MNENNFHKEGDEAMIETPQVLIDATIARVEIFLKSHFQIGRASCRERV